jgi:hypothetical protein
MIAIDDLTVPEILEMCRNRRISNIAMGVALGYSAGAIAQFVLTNHDAKFAIPDADLGEYLNCGYMPSVEELKYPLVETIKAINHRRWFEQPFDQYEVPNMDGVSIDKTKHWEDLKSFMQYNECRATFIQAIMLVMKRAPDAFAVCK